MKIGRKNIFLLFLLASMVLMGCGYKAPQTPIKETKDNTEQISENEDNKVIITVGDKEFNADDVTERLDNGLLVWNINRACRYRKIQLYSSASF